MASSSSTNAEAYEALRLLFESLLSEHEPSERDVEVRLSFESALSKFARYERDRERLNRGEYFMNLNELWTKTPILPLMEEEYVQLFRTQEQASRISCYQMNIERSNDDSCEPAEDASSRSSNGSVATSAWQQDIFFGARSSAQIAHLVPASRVNSLTWFHVVSWILGLQSAHIVELDKAILGVYDASHRRESLTGIKHLPQNKICLRGQATFYDTRPCVLVIPIMTLQEAKDWDGHQYEAIVVVGKWEDSSVEDVCSTIGMTSHRLLVKPSASYDDLLKATNLLNIVLRGMVYSLVAKLKLTPTRPEVLEKWNEMKEDFTSPTGHRELLIAALNDNRPQDKPVYKYTFRPDLHPPPDPILLAAKAANNWAKQQKFKLVAAGEYFEDEDGPDAKAERQYVEMLEQSYRAGSWEQLARGLHQHGHEVL